MNSFPISSRNLTGSTALVLVDEQRTLPHPSIGMKQVSICLSACLSVCFKDSIHSFLTVFPSKGS